MKILVLLTILIIELSSTVLTFHQEKGLFSYLFSSCKCRCGITNREARFIGGEQTKNHEFPWMALVQITKTNLAFPATIINNRFVITAASQLISLSPYDIKITLGQYDRCFSDVSSSNVSVEKLLIHPDFNEGDRVHDIALIKTSAPIIFERRISPVCLAFPDTKYLGQVATVVGWSEINVSPASNIAASSCRPRKVGLPVLGDSECLIGASNDQYFSEDKGCLGIIGASSIICQADAGSPVMYRSYDGTYELIGVITDKNKCGEAPSVALYTKINHHLSWITKNTKDACYCLKF